MPATVQNPPIVSSNVTAPVANNDSIVVPIKTSNPSNITPADTPLSATSTSIGSKPVILSQTAATKTKVSHGKIDISVKELTNFRKKYSSEAAKQSDLRRARTEKAVEDASAYSSAIANYITDNGEGVFDKAAARYKRDYGVKGSLGNIKPKKRTGRGSRIATLKERQTLVANVLKKHPEMSRYLLQEMAKETKYLGSDAHMAWSKAAEARTGGAISAKWWRELDPFGGTAGNGPNILATGAYPGALSKIAMGHDTDWSLGRFFGEGPLAKLRGAKGFTPEQLGQVGLNVDQPFGY
ncbi:MAG: hypothetical protein AAFV29_11335, partial [Myxococcota bacterium]